MPTHTPGPWLADEDALVGTVDKHICTVGVDGDPLTDEVMANAALIALAPDMELYLWACYSDQGGTASDDYHEMEIDGLIIGVPMAGHLPDTSHPIWPQVREELQHLRGVLAERGQ